MNMFSIITVMLQSRDKHFDILYFIDVSGQMAIKMQKLKRG